MQAVFRFGGAEEIVVSNQVNGVLVEIYSGYTNQCQNCKALGPRAACSSCPGGAGSALEQKALLTLSKGQARSVGSAIMGAAAEL